MKSYLALTKRLKKCRLTASSISIGLYISWIAQAFWRTTSTTHASGFCNTVFTEGERTAFSNFLICKEEKSKWKSPSSFLHAFMDIENHVALHSNRKCDAEELCASWPLSSTDFVSFAWWLIAQKGVPWLGRNAAVYVIINTTRIIRDHPVIDTLRLAPPSGIHICNINPPCMYSISFSIHASNPALQQHEVIFVKGNAWMS